MNIKYDSPIIKKPKHIINKKIEVVQKMQSSVFSESNEYICKICDHTIDIKNDYFLTHICVFKKNFKELVIFEKDLQNKKTEKNISIYYNNQIHSHVVIISSI